MNVRRIALGVQYDGTTFRGWQSQPGGGTVQDVLETALQYFTSTRISTVVAGRTDAGVHALGQVVHFDTSLSRSEFSWVRGVNSYLPSTIAIQWAAEVKPTFHARFSALARTYDYIMHVGSVRPALLAHRVGWIHTPISVDPMRKASCYLLGTRDFSSFRSAGCQARSPVRTIYQIHIVSNNEFIRFRFCANAFLQHMVRNLIGCLLVVGQGREGPDWIEKVMTARDRRKAAPTFMSNGLYLSEINYHPDFLIPYSTLGPLPGQVKLSNDV